MKLRTRLKAAYKALTAPHFYQFTSNRQAHYTQLADEVTMLQLRQIVRNLQLAIAVDEEQERIERAIAEILDQDVPPN